MADNDLTNVHSFAAGGHQIRASVVCWRGEKYLDLRRYFETAAGRWCPTSKGIRVHEDHLVDLADALDALRSAVDDDTDADTATGSEIAAAAAG